MKLFGNTHHKSASDHGDTGSIPVPTDKTARQDDEALTEAVVDDEYEAAEDLEVSEDLDALQDLAALEDLDDEPFRHFWRRPPARTTPKPKTPRIRPMTPGKRRKRRSGSPP